MLYGNQKVQEEIIEQVKLFEKKYNKKVVFGAMVGSISKGMERFDSDYDTRFLYLDPTDFGYIRWDKLERDIAESQIHFCYIPDKHNCYVEGDNYRASYQDYDLKDKSFFYDKIAFWEITSFVNFLKNPRLDNKFSIGLYHIVSWTFRSPFCWDPYGIAEKISALLDEMFVAEYEIQYYRDYILKSQSKKPVRFREYLYSVYYALAIEYCLKHQKFAPVYFKTLLAMCSQEDLVRNILRLEDEYYSSVSEAIRCGKKYERKMANLFSCDNNIIIDAFINDILKQTEVFKGENVQRGKADYVDEIINIILGSLNRPTIKGVND